MYERNTALIVCDVLPAGRYTLVVSRYDETAAPSEALVIVGGRTALPAVAVAGEALQLESSLKGTHCR